MSGRWIRFLGWLGAIFAVFSGHNAQADYPVRNIFTALNIPEPGKFLSSGQADGIYYGNYRAPMHMVTGADFYRAKIGEGGIPDDVCDAEDGFSATKTCGYAAFCRDGYLYCPSKTYFEEHGCAACITDEESPPQWGHSCASFTPGDNACIVILESTLPLQATESEYYFLGCVASGNTARYVSNRAQAYDTWYWDESWAKSKASGDNANLCADCPYLYWYKEDSTGAITGWAARDSDSVICYADAGTVVTMTGLMDDKGFYEEVIAGECYYDKQIVPTGTTGTGITTGTGA